MKTVIIQIGNSDNKLTQQEWSQFYHAVGDTIASEQKSGIEIHFCGTSPTFAPWQNACWVIAGDLEIRELLSIKLGKLCSQFKQDSIAWTEGTTEFLKS